jgi:hypothetical protein
MKRRKGVSKRRIWAALASAVVFMPGAARATEITSTWSGNTGNWTDPTQWSTNPNYPDNGTPSGTTYDAVIDAPGTGPYTVSLNSNVTTDSVTLDSANATLSQTGGTLAATTMNIMAGTYVFSGGSKSFASLINAGTVRATGGGTLSFGGSIDNTGGTTVVDPNSEVVIDPPTLTTAQVGNLVNNGGTIVLGGLLDNTGNTLSFGGPTGTWELAADVQNGVVNLPSTTILGGPEFDNVTLACNLTESANFGSISIDGINAAGHTINILGNRGDLFVGHVANASETLSNIIVNLGGSTTNALGGYLVGALALDPTTDVNGWGGVGVDGSGNHTASLANQGVVTAGVPGETLLVAPTLLTNTGALGATNGGILAVAPSGSTSWTNGGVLSVDNLSTIKVNQNLSFTDGAAFEAILGSNGASGLLSIAGSLDLSHDEFLNLSVAPGAIFSTPYEIISYTGTLTGTFAQVTPGFVVDYSNPGEILVTAVPEPDACALVASGAFIAMRRRRRRDKSRS